MKKETRTAVYDDELHIEAYRFEGIAQPFPNHFHDCYVIGLIEEGKRALSCGNRRYTAESGDMLLFNPGDSHACVQSGSDALTYLSLHIAKENMECAAEEAGGRREAPVFSPSVVRDEEAAGALRSLHGQIVQGLCGLEKEEQLLFFLSLLVQRYGRNFAEGDRKCRKEIARACAFMEQHCAETIHLEQLCRCAGLSKSALLRAFTKEKGVTPYRYLENLRIDKARRMLEKGMPPIEVALLTGFSDQGHFTNYFSRFIGIAPGVYREIFWGKRETKPQCEANRRYKKELRPKEGARRGK